MLTMRNREWWALLFAPDDGGGSGDDPDDQGEPTGQAPKDEPAPSDPEPKGKQSTVDPALALAKAAVKKAEREAAAAKKRADDLEAATLSDKEKAERRAAEAEAKADAATERVRRANLLSTLVEKGLQSPKAALRLLDGVEFDDDDEPTNVDDAIKAASAEFGDDLFRTTRRVTAGDINSGRGNDGQGQGPKLTSAELQMAGSLGQTPEQYAYYRDNPNAQQPYEPQVAAGSR